MDEIQDLEIIESTQVRKEYGLYFVAYIKPFKNNACNHTHRTATERKHCYVFVVAFLISDIFKPIGILSHHYSRKPTLRGFEDVQDVARGFDMLETLDKSEKKLERRLKRQEKWFEKFKAA